MGIIPLKNDIENNKKDFLIYFMTKYKQFNRSCFKINEKGDHYMPKLYTKYLKIKN